MPEKTVEAYLKDQPAEAREKLEKMRQIIREAAPQAEESISYMMPAYKYHGPLVYIGGFKDHVSLFPAGGSIQDIFKDELKPYKTGKGTIQFPLDKPLPVALIKKIVKVRVLQNEAKQ